MKLSEAAQEVIYLAEAIRAQWYRELPKRHPRYPLIQPGEDSGPPPPEAARLESLLKSLPEEQVYILLLLMYIGRGDCGTGHLAESYQSLRETFEKPELAVSQMMDQPVLADYLLDGLEELKKDKIDIDRISFSKSTASSRN